MSDETKVPPGWVRLTRNGDDNALYVRASRITAFARGHSCTNLYEGGDGAWNITESPAEVAALIAAAQAAERRARVMPVMAAVADLMAAVAQVRCGPDDCVERADAILGAIEREKGEG